MAAVKKFGKVLIHRKKTHDALGRDLFMTRYLQPGLLPPLPAETSNALRVGDDCGMLGNDEAGDCVEAAVLHWLQDVIANAGAPATFTTEQALQLYSQFTGYVPGDESTDQGTDPMAFLNFVRSVGVFGHKIGAYSRIPNGNIQMLQYGIYLFDGVIGGADLPNSALQRDDWMYTLDPANNPDDVPLAENGHEVEIVDFLANPLRFRVRTWGGTRDMSPAFYASCFDQTIAIYSEESLRTDRTTAQGFDRDLLLSDLSRVGRMQG